MALRVQARTTCEAEEPIWSTCLAACQRAADDPGLLHSLTYSVGRIWSRRSLRRLQDVRPRALRGGYRRSRDLGVPSLERPQHAFNRSKQDQKPGSGQESKVAFSILPQCDIARIQHGRTCLNLFLNFALCYRHLLYHSSPDGHRTCHRLSCQSAQPLQ